MTFPLLIGGAIDTNKLGSFRFCNLKDEREVNGNNFNNIKIDDNNFKIGKRQVILDPEEFSCLRLVNLKPDEEVYAVFVAKIEP